MLHLQLDGTLMNGARQEHYMFDPGLSWPLSSSVKSVSGKVSVYRKIHSREIVFFWPGIVKENDM